MQQTSPLETSGEIYPSLRPPLRSKEARARRHLLLTELDELWVTILVKRAHLNALAPISYLPPEILGRIFHHIARVIAPRLYYSWEDHALEFSRFRKTSFKSLVNIARVCSHWRQVAIQHSMLWFCPPLELGSDWMRTMLLRSGSAPLVIEAHQGGPILRSAMIQPIYEHLSHIQTLHLSSSHDVLSQLLPKLTQPARMLVSLSLDQPQNFRPSPTEAVVSRLPQDLFGNNAPNLRMVSLINCVVPWNCTVFQNLVSLHINVPGPRVDPLLCSVGGVLTPLFRSELLPSISQLFAVLKVSPGLRSLGLRGVLPRASSISLHHPTSTSHDIYLHDLRELSLNGAFRDCAALLSRMVFPNRVDLCLECSFEGAEGREAECTALFSALEQHFDRFSCRDIASFHEFYYSDSQHELAIKTKLCHIAITTPMDVATRTDFLQRYFSTIPLAEAFSLTFDDINEVLGFDQLMDIFTHENLEGVYSVTIFRGRIDAFCAALSALEDASAAGHPARFRMCQFLTRFDIDEFDFTEFTDLEMISLQKKFAFLLQEREDYGYPIEHVEFSFCPGLREAWTDALRVVESTEICFTAAVDENSTSQY